MAPSRNAAFLAGKCSGAGSLALRVRGAYLMGMCTELYFRAEIDEYAANFISAAIAFSNQSATIIPESAFADYMHENLSAEYTNDDALWQLINSPRGWHLFSVTRDTYPPGYRFSYVIENGLLEDTVYFSIHTSIKNYDFEIQKFINWITGATAETAPSHIVNSGAAASMFIGYSLYEEDTEPKTFYTDKFADLRRKD